MKSILVLSKHFFPETIVGAVRVSFTAGYLHQMGWKTTVIAADTSNSKNTNSETTSSNMLPEQHIHRIKYLTPLAKSWVGSLRGLTWDIMGRPEFTQAQDLLLKKMVSKADQIIDEHKPSVIYCTTPPSIMAHIGHSLSLKHNIPFVIDMRDVPQQYIGAGNFIYKRRYRLDCKRMAIPISAASAVITVSDGLREILHSQYGCDVHLIYNGFDHLAHESAAMNKKNHNDFTITYTGSLSFLGLSVRSPEPLFQAIDMLLKKQGYTNLNWKIQFVGLSPDDLKPLQHYKSFAMSEFVDRIPYEESVLYQHSATILLHLTHRGRKGIMTSKIFDYLAANRPILTIPGDNDCVDELLNITGAGVSLEDPEEIAEQLMKWYLQWKETGHISNDVNQKEIAKYSRKNQTKKLAAILDSVADGNRDQNHNQNTKQPC